MKIAVAASDKSINSQIDQHFGRCPWYCIYDTITKKIEFIENPAYNQLKDAGYMAVDLLSQKGISVVIAGRFGSKVMEVLRSKDVQMIVPHKERTIKEIIKHFK